MAVSKIQPGQLWRQNETGDTWLVTKLYAELFSSFAVMRKVGGTGEEVRRVKIKQSAEGAALPGFTFTQEMEGF